jgi:chemotaxis protein CheZ
MSVNVNENTSHADLLLRVGHMTRLLHDSLRGLGLDKLLEKAAEDIPDARDRLDYVAKMSGLAAQRVLNATDFAIPLQTSLDDGAKKNSLELHSLLAHLMDIMMAQDFQDLTGQVIKKVTELVHNLEQQLMQLLIEYSPEEKKREVSDSLLNGHQINPKGKTDVVSDQGRVDDLLYSLGF